MVDAAAQAPGQRGDAPRTALLIDGMAYEGWESIRITRSIESLSGEFELGLSVRQYTGAPRWPLRTGHAAAVVIDGETVISGYIDRIDPQFDESAHSISVSGRDRTADLVDCSAIHKPGSWSNARIEAIAADLAKPFGIRIEAAADTGKPVRKFAVQQGESVHAAIERLARYRGFLAVATAAGDVRFINPGQGAAVAEITEGVNIIGASANHDATERFSDYLLKGQSAGDDHLSGKAAAGPSASARDPGITRYRPLLIIGEDQSDAAGLAARAKWEATVRAGRAQSATLTIPGWRAPDGALWRPDQMVNVTAPGLFITGKMLVSEVTLVKDDRGTVTELGVKPPEAFSQLAVPEGRDAASIGGAA